MAERPALDDSERQLIAAIEANRIPPSRREKIIVNLIVVAGLAMLVGSVWFKLAG